MEKKKEKKGEEAPTRASPIGVPAGGASLPRVLKRRIGAPQARGATECKGILPLTFILINNDKQASDDLMCLASLICRF
jgi:hypothetical protein